MNARIAHDRTLPAGFEDHPNPVPGDARQAPGRPWQSLYFLPEPQGHGAFRGVPA